MSPILSAVLIVSTVGLLAGAGLAAASLFFGVKKDEKELELLAMLPGANCGGCGYAGCAEYARALCSGGEGTGKCPVGGGELAFRLSSFLGINDPDATRKTAFVHCRGSRENTGKKSLYQGVATCRSLNVVGGDGLCPFGCLGLGDCVKVCEFGALCVRDGAAFVSSALCVGCGKCAFVCPRSLISVHWADNMPAVACRNTEKGAVVRRECRVGCVGCSLCSRSCPHDAIHVRNNIAVIDIESCVGCLECTQACKANVIKTYS